MADLAVPEAGAIRVQAGFLSRFARTQYAALAKMRTRMFVNSLRSNQGVFEFSARAVAFFTYGLMGVGMGVGAAAVAFSLVARGQWHLLPVEFWVVFLVWQSVAVALASFQEQYDMGALLRFPVGFGSFYTLFLLFGLIDTSTLLGSLCCLGIWAGVVISHPQLFGWSFLILAAFAVFNVLTVRAVLSWVDRWLAKRRSREIVSALFLVAMVSLQLLNPAVRGQWEDDGSGRKGPSAELSRLSKLAKPWVDRVEAIQVWLPPGLASEALRDAAQKQNSAAMELIALSGCFVVGAGGVLGLRLRAEYRGESLGEAPSRKENEVGGSDWRVGGGPVAAVFEKEVRTLLRAMPQLYSLLVPVVMVFVIGGLFRTGHHVVHQNFRFALPVCVAYGLLGFTQMMYNNLGAEARGIQMLFLAPVPIRAVMLGKNLFHAVLYLIVAVLALILANIRLGHADAAVIAATVAWILFALPANLAAGNILSITMAYRINLGRIGRQSGSQANALLSMLIQTLVLGIGSGVIALCVLLGDLWWASGVLLVLAIVATAGWWQILRHVDAMATARRDTLVTRLAKTE